MATYFSLWLFILFMVATPGPANLLLMSAGATHGYLRLLPFLLGLIVGKLAMNLAISWGLADLIVHNPQVSSFFGLYITPQS